MYFKKHLNQYSFSDKFQIEKKEFTKELKNKNQDLSYFQLKKNVNSICR